MIRPARIEDTEEILTLIHELAVYEKAPDEAKATAEQIQKTFFYMKQFYTLLKFLFVCLFLKLYINDRTRLTPLYLQNLTHS